MKENNKKNINNLNNSQSDGLTDNVNENVTDNEVNNENTSNDVSEEENNVDSRKDNGNGDQSDIIDELSLDSEIIETEIEEDESKSKFFTKDNRSATKVAVLPKKYAEKYKKKPSDKKKSWFEPAGYTESVSTIHNILKTIVYIIFKQA